MNLRTPTSIISLALAVAIGAVECTHGQLAPPAIELSIAKEMRTAISRGADYLVARQYSNGSWSNSPEITADVFSSLSTAGYAVDAAIDVALHKGRRYIEAHLQRCARDAEAREAAVRDLSLWRCIAVPGVLATSLKPDQLAILKETIIDVEEDYRRGLSHASIDSPGPILDLDRYRSLLQAYVIIDGIIATDQLSSNDGGPANLKLLTAAATIIGNQQIIVVEDSNHGPSCIGRFRIANHDPEFATRPEIDCLPSVRSVIQSCAGLACLRICGMDETAPRVQYALNWIIRNFSNPRVSRFHEPIILKLLNVLSTTNQLFNRRIFDSSNTEQRTWILRTIKDVLTSQGGNGGWEALATASVADDSSRSTAYAIGWLAEILESEGIYRQ